MRWLLLVFALVVGTALSQESTPEKPKHKRSEPSTKARPQQRGTEQLPLVVKAAEKTQAEAESEKAERHDKAWNERWLTYSTAWLAAVTTALALFTYWLWGATRKLVIGSEDTAKRELRAYLSVDGIPYFSHVDKSTGRVWWSIHPQWKNGGNTPTKHLFLNTNSLVSSKPLPEDFEFPEAKGETIKMLIGAHSSIGAATQTIDGSDLADVASGSRFFYIWGWAKYRDVFNGTPERITKFCCQITNVTGNPTKPYDRVQNIVEITFAYYKKHNCMDDDCA
jgi:hypothetical protein